MKEYTKPTIVEETIILEDIIAASGNFGDPDSSDTPANFDIFDN